MREDGAETVGPRDAASSVGNGFRQWLLLDGSRWQIASGVLVVVFVLLSALSATDLLYLRSRIAMFYIFSALVGGNLTLITVVISINQLILSRQLESPGEVEDELEDVTEYRREVEADTETPLAPIQPSNFLHLLLERCREDVRSFEAGTTPTDDEQLRREVDRFSGRVLDHLDEASGLLERELSLFNALTPTLVANYGEYIHDARRLQLRYSDTLPEDAIESLDAVIDRLRELDVARQYFKSLYIQEELAYLSKMILYVGVPVEVLSIVMVLVFARPASLAISLPALAVLASVAIAISLSPLAILFAIVLRVATVAQHTIAVAPFTAPTDGL